MRILAVDTTHAHASIALLDSGTLRGVVGVHEPRPQHAESLLPRVDYLLSRLEMKLADVEGYAVAVGPGSFTGLRIGIAATEGLAFATGRPIVGVSALEATVFRYRYRPGLLVAMIDAYRGEIYGASYHSDGRSIAARSDPVCQPPETFLERLTEAPQLVAGSGAVRHRADLRTRWGEDVLVADASFFLAEEVARLGAPRLAAGESANLGELQALYLRASDAERHREQKETSP